MSLQNWVILSLVLRWVFAIAVALVLGGLVASVLIFLTSVIEAGPVIYLPNNEMEGQWEILLRHVKST